METEMNKKTEILRIVLVIWFLATTSYVAYDLWTEYQINGIQKAYQGGVEDTVNEIIKQTETSNCQAIDVYSNEKKIQLVDVKCVPQSEPIIEK